MLAIFGIVAQIFAGLMAFVRALPKEVLYPLLTAGALLFFYEGISIPTVWPVSLVWSGSVIDGRVDRVRAAAETVERGKWQVEMARLQREHALRRQADEEKLRTIVLTLNDERAVRREQQNDFDRSILELEQADQASGAAPNDFDSRVLRLVR